MTDSTENYQRQMQEQYETTAKYRPDESEVRMRREFYPVDAVAEFKREYWPADPFDGCLVDANYLDVAELTNIYKAAAALKAQNKQVFAENSIQHWKSPQFSHQLVVRVNHLYIDAKRQRTLEIGELLHEFYFGTCESFTAKRQEILDMGDVQLLEFVQQVEESLGLTERELKVMEAIDEN